MLKELRDKLCELCLSKYHDEWANVYTGTREGFRDWLNRKTGLTVCHITNKEVAFKAWIKALEADNDTDKPTSST
jgi:hypothetical protein